MQTVQYRKQEADVQKARKVIVEVNLQLEIINDIHEGIAVVTLTIIHRQTFSFIFEVEVINLPLSKNHFSHLLGDFFSIPSLLIT